MKILTTLATLLVLTACSGTEKPESKSSLPTCEAVWQAGAELPSDYEGCLDGDALVAVITNGAGQVSYDDSFLAKPGETIKEVQ